MNEPDAEDRTDRVRAHTDPDVLSDLDAEMVARVRRLAADGPGTITARLAELDRESDIERVLEINASVLALSGVALGAFAHRRWLALPAVVLGFLLQHAIQGWCPPIPVLRRLGVRTRAEIDAERFALKYLRGDFTAPPRTGDPAREALEAVRGTR
jgi:hypothetical protein